MEDKISTAGTSPRESQKVLVDPDRGGSTWAQWAPEYKNASMGDRDISEYVGMWGMLRTSDASEGHGWHINSLWLAVGSFQNTDCGLWGLSSLCN